MRKQCSLAVGVVLLACSFAACGGPQPHTGNGSGAAASGATGWAATAVQYRGRNGKRYFYDCAPHGTPGKVWGNGTYTDDSSVCTAAMMESSIENDGKVLIEIRPGRASYVGSTMNGITSSDWDSWSGSFVICHRPSGGGSVPKPSSWTCL